MSARTPPTFPAGTLIPPRQELTLGEKVVRAVLLLAGLGLVVSVGWLLRFLVLPVALGLLLTYVLSPVVDRLESRGLSRSRAVALCFGLLLGLVGLLAYGIVPTLESWLNEMPKEGE